MSDTYRALPLRGRPPAVKLSRLTSVGVPFYADVRPGSPALQAPSVVLENILASTSSSLQFRTVLGGPFLR